jgi:hypothetical protein
LPRGNVNLRRMKYVLQAPDDGTEMQRKPQLLFYLKAQITQMAVQKMEGVVQKNASQTPFSLERLTPQTGDKRALECRPSSHTMIKAGSHCPAANLQIHNLSVRSIGLAFGRRGPIFQTMLRPAPYLSKKLTRPLPTKDGGVLRTVKDARTYMMALSKHRKTSAQWQRAAAMLLEQVDVTDLSSQVQLALFYDGKLDLAALSEPV